MRRFNNTRVVFVLVIFLFTLIISACQPTPDEPVIVNKNDGKLEAALHESPAPLKPYEAPAHWTETVNDERLKIIIDTDITMPDVDKYPVVKLEAAKFTQQRVDEMVDYFAHGKKLYLPGVKTKADYEAEIVEAKRGQEVDGKYVVTEDTKSYLKELEEKQAEAPDESPKVYTDTTLTYYKQSTGEEVIGSGKNFLNVMVENGDGNDASIIIGNFVAGYNLSTSFSYFAHQDADYISETRYHNVVDGSTEEEAGLTGVGALFDKVEITQEEAEAHAQKIIDGLGLRDLVLVSADKAVSPDATDNGAYQLEYMRQVGGIPAYMLTESSWFEGEKPPEYSPPFEEEVLNVLVTKDGVLSVGWWGCADIVETMTENADLLAFDKIQQRLKDQIFYKNSFNTGIIGRQDYETVVKFAELRMGYIGVKDNLNQALMVPAWVFDTETSFYNTYTKSRQSMGEDTFEFNAIDGGVIEPNRLDNILC